MLTTETRARLADRYEAAAQNYLRSLPLEHFMESIGQSRQREITLESLAVLKVRRPDVQVFSELLLQYPVRGQSRLGQVVPDNMVVLSDNPVNAELSFNLPLESARPFWMLEYVSRKNQRKDYEDNFEKYQRDLKVPYCLLFRPETQECALYHHSGKKYLAVKPRDSGRLPIPELDLEVGLLGGWVRYWYRGELLKLPAELDRDLDEARRELDAQQRRTAEVEIRLKQTEQELAKLRSRRQAPPARRGKSARRPDR